MSQYYVAQRKRNMFIPDSKNPFKISRSKIELFLKCPKCFYLDRRYGISQPPGYPFTLNSAVDKLLKSEFDKYRVESIRHPLCEEFGINAVPFKHPELETWRNNFKGISFHHKKTNLLIHGAIDDIWVNDKKELMIVDYKSTSKDGEVTIDAEWQDGYKRQMEIYQWLFSKNGYTVSSTGYFVYCNGDTKKETFDKKLEFVIKVLPYIGSFDWVDNVINEIYVCLMNPVPPKSGIDCDFCIYRETVKTFEANIYSH